MVSASACDNSTACLPRLPGEAVRLSMRLVIVAWAFGAVFFCLAGGAIYTSFARQLGVSDTTFGFLAGVTPLMSFVQLPAARLLETRLRPRQLMLWAGITSRGLWVVAASLPLVHKFIPDLFPREWMLPAFVTCVVISSFGQACTGPAFFSWMSSLVPSRVGPSFWARRQQIGMIMAIFATIIGGMIADQAGYLKAWSQDEFPPLLLYSVVLTVAAICGVMDIVLFWNVRETPEHIQQMAGRPRRTTKTVARALRDRPVTENTGRVWRGVNREAAEMVASLQQPLRERLVRNYLLFAGTAVMGFASQGALLWLLCLENFEWPKTQTGFVLTVAPMVAMALTSPFWGRMVKEHGTRPIARTVSILLIFIPVAWLLATPNSWWPMLVIVGISGFLAVAYDICNLNFITRAAPHLPRPTLTALFGITTGTVAGVTSWLAGAAAQQLEGFHLELLGREFVNYHVLFAFSLVVRIVNAFVFAPRLEEPDATPTREAVRETAMSLYLAFISRLTAPFGARD